MTNENAIQLIQQKGAKVHMLACLAELPDLKGREVLQKLGVKVYSPLQFDGN